MTTNKAGRFLRGLREQRRWTLTRLGKAVGVNVSYLSRIEAGKVPPSNKLLRRLAMNLGLPPEDLRARFGKLPHDVREIFAANPSEAAKVIRSSFPAYNQRPYPMPAEQTPHVSVCEILRKAPSESRVFTVIDLFAGAGGFTLGLHQTKRFLPVWANDSDEWCTATYNHNFGGHGVQGDINDILGSRHQRLPPADVIIGGPPCQGFSLLNKNRAADPRKGLWQAYMRAVELVRPAVFVMENVPELLRSLEFCEIRRLAAKWGYELAAATLNAADYGVPQRRRRAIVIGSRIGTPFLPRPTHFDPRRPPLLHAEDLLPWLSVGQAIGDLNPPVGTELRVRKVPPPMDLHFGRTPTPASLERYRCIPEGGNRLDLQRRRPDLTPGCWLRKKSGGTDLFGRLWRDRPAYTIRTEFFKPEKGRYLHPAQHRPITHREAARLQAFPDDFVFLGPKIEVAKQIGNAVPPPLAKHIGRALLALLLDTREQCSWNTVTAGA